MQRNSEINHEPARICRQNPCIAALARKCINKLRPFPHLRLRQPFHRRLCLPPFAQCNHNRRRNQQRSPACNYYYPFCHLTIQRVSQLNFSAFNSRAYTVKPIQQSPTLLSHFSASPSTCEFWLRSKRSKNINMTTLSIRVYHTFATC